MLKGSSPCEVEFKVFVVTMGIIFNKTLFAFGFGGFFFLLLLVLSNMDNIGEFFCGFS